MTTSMPGTRTFDDQVFVHRRATVESIDLHYVISGKGRAVVLLHGWPETWFQYRHLIAALAEQFTVIVPDLRGAGDSSKPPSGYDKKTMANDIAGLVRQLGFSHASVAGHDIGGMVAYALAAVHRDLIEKLVILDVPLPGIVPWEALKLDPRSWHFAFHQHPGIAETLVTGREQVYLTNFYRERAYNPSVFTQEVINEYVRSYAAPGALHAGFEYYRAFPQDERDNAELAKNKLKIPVLALGGEISSGSFLRQHLEEVAENVRGATIPFAGHWIVEENPEEVARHLLAFLSMK